MTGKISERIKYWLQIFLFPIYWISFITPRNKKIWLFGSTFGRRFADNPKYAYLYMSQFHSDEVRPIWISHNRAVIELLQKEGLEAYYYRSLKGIYYCLRAKVYIFDNYSKDISFWLSGGAVKINLWHGTATKKINQDNKFDHLRHPRNWKERFSTAITRASNEKPSHYVLATSKQMAPILAQAFGTTMDHTLVIGHPRNDILFPEVGIRDVYTSMEIKTRKRLEEIKSLNYKIIFYVPTFRDSEDIFFDKINLSCFNDFLRENNFMLCSKLHIKSKLKKRFEELDYSNIMNIDADVDPATILTYADMMIVDYSSIYLDYMLLERPCVAFPFDYKEYVSESRECYFDYNEYMPDIQVETMEELERVIVQLFQKDERYHERIERRKFHFDDIDGHSSERLYQAVQKICYK